MFVLVIGFIFCFVLRDFVLILSALARFFFGQIQWK